MNYLLRSQWKINLAVFSKRWYITFYPPTCNKLYKMKLKISPSCDRCGHPYENSLHFLYECLRNQTIWQMVIAWWNKKWSEAVVLNATDILHGYKPDWIKCFSSPWPFCYYCKIAHLPFVVKQSLSQLWGFQLVTQWKNPLWTYNRF